MKKILSCLLVLLLIPAMALAMEIVEPGEDFYYLDEPDVLSRDTEGEIYYCNQLLEEQCGSQIVVVALNSIGGADMLDYAVELANAWEIGDQEKNNGFVLLMTIQDEDYYAVPGDGLQGIFPASVLKEFFDDYLEADFAVGNYDEGARKFFEAVYERIADFYNLSLTPADGIALYNNSEAGDIAPQPTDPTARKLPKTNNTNVDYNSGYDSDYVSTYNYEPDYEPPRQSGGIGFGFIFWLIVILVIIFSVVALCGRSRRRRRGDYYDAPPPPPRHPFMTGLFVGSAMHRHNNPPPPRRSPGPSPRPPRSSGFSGGAGRGGYGGGAGRNSFSGGASRSSSSRSSSGSSSRGSFGGARGGGGGHFGGGAGRGRH